MINLITSVLENSVQGIQGELTGTYNESANLYTSTIDGYNNLIYKYAYDIGLSNIPLLVIMHGWNGDMDEFTINEMRKFASYKYFVIAPGMRGRNDADGSRDASARELMDIYDAIFNVYNYFPKLIDKSKLVIAGWSGGGGNVLGMCSKFPDLFNSSIVNFGMVDYGYDAIDSWRVTNPGYNTSIVDAVGVAVSETNEYLSRNHLNSITNYKGYLYIFHDTEDPTVDVINSQNIDTEELTGQDNYEYHESTIGDADRWTHGAPFVGSDIEKAEAFWKVDGLTRIAKTIPIAGSLYISGYIVTKRFEVWLGDGVDSSKDGTNRSATLVYDTSIGSYTVTPVLEGTISDVEVKIIQFDWINRNNKTATQIISSQTEIIVS